MSVASSDVNPEISLLSKANTGWGVVVFTLLTFAMIALAWDGLASLPEAWAREEYSHGWLIAPLALFLFLRQYQATVRPEKIGGRLPGLMLAIFGLALIVLGNLTGIPDVTTYGFILWVGGMVLLLFGWRYGMRFWAPVAYLVFMLPLPNFIYWQLSIFLQIISSEIGVSVIRLFGVPVFLDGNVIDLGVYKLLVSEACSGLRYLFPLMSFGFLFAVLYNGPWWHKVILFLSAAPITILMNSFRIGMIGLLVDRWGIEQAEGFLHTFEGWVIFITGIALLFLECILLQRLSRDRRPLADTLDLQLVSVKKPLLQMAAMPLTRSLIAVTALTAALAVGFYLLPQNVAGKVERSPLGVYPLKIGDWRGETQQIEPTVENVLKADDYLLANYVSDSSPVPVNMFVAYYFSQTNGSGIHSPEVCIPSGGWEVSAWEQRTMQLESVNGTEKINYNRAIISKGLTRQVVYYWFEQRGRRLDNDYVSKLYTVWDSIVRGRTDGGLVRFVTPILIDEEEGQADTRLQEFIALNLGELEQYLPK